MVDLKPDTSIYDKFTKGQNIGDLLVTALRARELGSQQSLSSAIKQHPDDPEALQKQLNQDPSFYATPDTQTAINRMHASNIQLQGAMFEPAAKMITSLLSNPDYLNNPTDPKWQKWFAQVAPTIIGQTGMKSPAYLFLSKNIGDPNIMRQVKSGLINAGTISEQMADSVDPQGRHISVPQSQLPFAGQPGSAGIGAPPPGAGTPPPMQPLPNADPLTQSISGYRPPLPAPAPAGGVVRELSPGTRADYESSGKLYAERRSMLDNYGAIKQPLEQAIEELQHLDDKDLGPASRTFQKIKGVIMQIGSPELVKKLGIDPQKVSDWDSADKFLQQYAGVVSGGGTDARLLNAYAGNPGMEKQRQANLHVARLALGALKMQKAQFNAFGQTGLDPVHYGHFGQWWNPKQDIAGYAWDDLTPDERARIVAPMKNRSEIERLKQSRDISRQQREEP